MAESTMQHKVWSLVSTALEGKHDIDAFYSDLAALGAAEEVSSELVDISWLLWLKLDGSQDKKMRLVELMKECIRDKKVDRKMAMETLDQDCMQALGLVPDVELWKKKEIRYSTKINYTQTKYNLLREDSEGYSKLVTALNQFGSAALTEQVAPMLCKEIQALIGYFDLDPNRCLDLVLEAAEQQPTNKAYIRLIPMFKRDAVVHLIGFKFQQSQMPGATCAWSNLFHLAATLVAEGLVSLDELLGHLAPSDANIKTSQEATREALRREVDAIGQISLAGGSAPQAEAKDYREHQQQQHALMRSGGAGTATNQSNHNEQLQPVMRRVGISAAMLELDPAANFERLLLDPSSAHNQKLGLLQALAEIGAWPEANQLMERLVSLGVEPAAFGPFCATLCSVLQSDIEATYAAVIPKGIFARCLLDDPKESTPGPRLPARVYDVLNHLGMFISRDVKLFTKVIRVLRHDMHFYCTAEQMDAEETKGKVEEVLLSCLLPGFALVPAMPSLSAELWKLVKLFPFETRYKLYADLKEMTERTPYLMASAKMAVYETRKILKRLHMPPDRREKKEACKPHGRMLAKAACANPLHVHEAILATIESYSNQIEPVIEALKYMTPMSFDVLTHVILSRLSTDRDKIKDDGINISDWLKSIAEFTGSLCRKQPEMEISALVQYLSNALRAADSLDLLVLKELVSQLTGITATLECSDIQVESLGGGPLLQERTMVRDVERSSRAWSRGAKRLLEALQRGATPQQHLALPMLLLVAQQRQIIMVRTEAQYIKFVVELYDRCQETCLQYIEFLKTALSFEEYVQLLPPIDALRKDYGLNSDVLFLMYRPVLEKLMLAAPDGDAAAPALEEMEEGEEAPTVQTDVVPKVVAPLSSEPVQIGGLSWPNLMHIVRTVFAPSPIMWDSMSPELYAMFWTLSLPDIFVPLKRYEAEMEAAQREVQECDRQLGVMRNQPPPMAGPSYEQYDADMNEQRRAKARAQEMLQKLPIELAAAKKHFGTIMARLEREKPTLLCNVASKKGIATVMVQECVMPRLLFSPMDALFCAKFPALLHSISVPYFSTVWYYNELLKDMVPILKCITDREATHLGIFLLETLRLLSHWRSSEAVYKEDCESCCGFGISLTELDERKTSYEQYKRLLYKWHGNCVATFRACLDNTEWTSRRNALNVLTRIASVFPVVDQHQVILRKYVEKIRDTDEREDLKVLSKSYLANVDRECAKPGRLVSPVAFGGPSAGKIVKKPVAAGAAAPKPVRVAPVAPTALRADAKAFIPTSTAPAAAASTEGGAAVAATGAAAAAAASGGAAKTSAPAAAAAAKVGATAALAASASTKGGAVVASSAKEAAAGGTAAAAVAAAPAAAFKSPPITSKGVGHADGEGRGGPPGGDEQRVSKRAKVEASSQHEARPESHGRSEPIKPASTKAEPIANSERGASGVLSKRVPPAAKEAVANNTGGSDRERGGGSNGQAPDKGAAARSSGREAPADNKNKGSGDKERGSREPSQRSAAGDGAAAASPADVPSGKERHHRKDKEKEERREERKRVPDQGHTDEKPSSAADHKESKEAAADRGQHKKARNTPA